MPDARTKSFVRSFVYSVMYAAMDMWASITCFDVVFGRCWPGRGLVTVTLDFVLIFFFVFFAYTDTRTRTKRATRSMRYFKLVGIGYWHNLVHFCIVLVQRAAKVLLIQPDLVY